MKLVSYPLKKESMFSNKYFNNDKLCSYEKDSVCVNRPESCGQQIIYKLLICVLLIQYDVCIIKQ